MSLQSSNKGLRLSVFVLQLAAQRYWSWVAAGQRYRVAESLLKIAADRDNFLRESVKLAEGYESLIVMSMLDREYQARVALDQERPWPGPVTVASTPREGDPQ